MYGYVQPNSKQVTSATNGDGQNYFNINSNATNTCESPHPVRLLILKRYLYFKNDFKSSANFKSNYISYCNFSLIGNNAN